MSKKEMMIWVRLIVAATICYGVGDITGRLVGFTKLMMFWSGMAYCYYLHNSKWS